MTWLLPVGVLCGYLFALIQARVFWKHDGYCPICGRFARPALPHDVEVEP